MIDANDVDLVNAQLIGVQGDHIVVNFPKQMMTKDEALVQAAWLVALADDGHGRWETIYERVCNI